MTEPPRLCVAEFSIFSLLANETFLYAPVSFSLIAHAADLQGG
jgi:hypothetical protein